MQNILQHLFLQNTSTRLKFMSDIFNKFLFFTSKNMKDVFYFT